MIRRFSGAGLIASGPAAGNPPLCVAAPASTGRGVRSGSLSRTKVRSRSADGTTWAILTQGGSPL